MAKIGRPTGLIGYDTEMNVQRRIAREEPVVRIVRPRTILYAALIVLVGALMTYTLATRTTLGVSALHDRNPVFVRLADGSLRNAFTVRLTNKTLEARPFRLEVLGLPEVTLDVVGEPHTAEQSALLDVGPDQTRELRVLRHRAEGRSTCIPSDPVPAHRRRERRDRLCRRLLQGTRRAQRKRPWR